MNHNNSTAFEANFDGIVGPTHNYSGLSFGNIASMEHSQIVSNPRAAAHQGLNKMRTLSTLGIKQAVLPPQERPFIPLLRTLGYSGNDASLLHRIARDNQSLLLSCCSAASMWAANAATTSPSADSQDRKVHFTPANLISKLHRSIEPPTTQHVLQKIFANPNYFVHHTPLPAQDTYSDEGAANHTRFCKSYHRPGVQLFVYGREAAQPSFSQPNRFPARQTREASEAIARLHQILAEQLVFAQQNPSAIDAGVFHNDVIAVGNQSVFFFHEKAFIQTEKILTELKNKIEKVDPFHLSLIQVSEKEVSLQEAVRTYLFNSQIVTLNEGEMVLIAPLECQLSPSVETYLIQLLRREDHPIQRVVYQDIRQSMQNGGGPACLRLRVVLTQEEWNQVHSPVILTESLYEQLTTWIDTHYRDQLTLGDLADPQLLVESRQALDDLTQILQIGSIYSFQQT